MDINKASAEELENAFQVDGTRARYIVEHRQKQGSFKSWEDVKQVPGFEDKMVDNLRAAGLTLGKSERDHPAEHTSQASRESETQASARTTRAKGIDLNSATPEELERGSQLDGERARYLSEARI